MHCVWKWDLCIRSPDSSVKNHDKSRRKWPVRFCLIINMQVSTFFSAAVLKAFVLKLNLMVQNKIKKQLQFYSTHTLRSQQHASLVVHYTTRLVKNIRLAPCKQFLTAFVSALLEYCSTTEVCSWRSVVSRSLVRAVQTSEDAQRNHPGEADVWRCDGECWSDHCTCGCTEG